VIEHATSAYFYFARHGKSEANLRREFSNRGLKHPLTPRGREQVAALARTLRDALGEEGRRVCRLYSSPLLRARDTAEILSVALGVPVQVTDALREYDCGILEGRSDEAGWRLYDEVFEAWVRYGRREERIPGGESLADMEARFVPFVRRLLVETQDFASPHAPLQPAHVILIGHGGLYRCMLPLVLDNVAYQWTPDVQGAPHLGNTTYVLAQKREGRLVAVEWCGVPLDAR
jgi:probable phosphoglycerate mutase